MRKFWEKPDVFEGLSVQWALLCMCNDIKGTVYTDSHYLLPQRVKSSMDSGKPAVTPVR